MSLVRELVERRRNGLRVWFKDTHRPRRRIRADYYPGHMLPIGEAAAVCGFTRTTGYNRVKAGVWHGPPVPLADVVAELERRGEL